MIFGVKGTKISLRIILFRITLAVIIAPLLLFSQTQLAIFFFVFAAFLSFFEGYIRKRIPFIPQSRLVFDFAADKTLVNVTAIILWFQGMIPFWVPLIFFIRDGLTILGGIIVAYRFDKSEFKPTTTGKIALFFQIVALLQTLINTADIALLTIAAGATIVSGVEAFFKSEFRKSRKKSDLSKFSLFSMIKIADFISLLNVVGGLLSIMFAISGNLTLAAIFMIFAVVADFFDGKVARALKQEHEFGKELDSLADTISFGVAPAVFAFNIIDSNLAKIAFAIFVFCGILRLARYNIINVKGEFAGMPITLNGVIVPAMYFLGMPEAWYPYAFLLLGILMISSIRFKKFGS